MSNAVSGKSLTAYLKQHALVRWFLAALLSFGGVCAFPWMLQLSGDRLPYTNSVWSVILFLACSCLFEKIFQTGFEGRATKWLIPALFGFLFSIAMVCGAQLELAENIPFSNGAMWISILVLSILFTLIVRYFWDKLDCLLAGSKEKSQEEISVLLSEKRAEVFSYKSWLKCAGIIFLCYIPIFLAVYPGFFVYDAQDELMQVITRNFSTHHPLIHVLLLGGIIQFGYKLSGSYNVGIACYTLFQMLLMAGIFAWGVEKLRSRGMKKGTGALLTAYFGLCPVLVMFSLCSAKDGLFTGMLFIQVLLLQELCTKTEQFLASKGKLVLFGLASLGMTMLRHNGFYAFVVFMILLLIYLRKYWKKLSVYFIGILIVYFLLNTGLTAVCRADASENQEKLTVPIMQMARIYAYEQGSLSEEELALMTTYLPAEALEHYTPKVSDSVKISFNNTAYEANSGSFWGLWIKLGVKHPFSYLNAWFMTSYGFWYPDTIIDSYRGNTVFTYTYEDSSYFGYEVEQPGLRQSLIPVLDEAYRRMSLEITQQKIPVISMLFAPGFILWVMLFILGYWCYEKRFKKVMPYLLPMLCFLTVLLGPTCLVRYVVFLWVLVPVMVWELRDEESTSVGIENE